MVAPSPTPPFTFLFTDIEGSTQLWERHPEQMRLAIARHDVILRTTIESHQGHVFKMVGDGLCAVFFNAHDALRATLTAQRELQMETWGETPIKVRMALHAGEAELRDNDYFGPMFNRLSRLLSAGHGGQTLLSDIVQKLIFNHLPEDVTLRDMGERRLRDLIRPEHIYQVLAPDLPAQFPPLKTLDTYHTNLPSQLTSFVGREKETIEIKQLLKANRLVTLTGPGGTGKTRLSLHVASEMLHDFNDGVFFTALASITDPHLVLPAIAAIFNIKESATQPVDTLLKQYLAEKHILLILDNLEQVISAVPRIAELLSAAPQLKVLASSREKLRIYGEQEYPVSPLTLPDSKQHGATSESEAVTLFVQRAKAANPHFELNAENIGAIAAICVRLDGLPLAIELAAARAKLLTPQATLERLSSRLKMLTGGAFDLPARQQTIRGAVDWSYHLLTEGEKRLFTRLGVFTGGWTLAAAEEICGQNLPMDALDGIESLADKSLIRRTDGLGNEPRFLMLETIREYSVEKLFESNEGPSIRDQHLAYFLALAERAETEMIGPKLSKWIRLLSDELDNIRAALEYALERDAQAGMKLASALLWFWLEAGYVSDGYRRLARLIGHPSGQIRTRARAAALNTIGYLAGGHQSSQSEVFREALTISKDLDDQHGTALSMLWLGMIVLNNDYVEGRAMVVGSLNLFRSLGDKVGMALALSRLGAVADKDNYALARSHLEQGLALCRETGFMVELVPFLNHLGELEIRHGNYAAARPWLEESLALQHELGKGGHTPECLGLLGELALREGDYTRARNLYQESVDLLAEMGWFNPWPRVKLGYAVLRGGDTLAAYSLFDKSQRDFKQAGYTIGVIYSLEGLASLAVREKRLDAAALIFAWADALRNALNDSRPPVEQADVERDMALVRTGLGDVAFAKACAQGAVMPMEQVIAVALRKNN